MEIDHNFLNLQQLKYDLFKSQDPDIGRFDVIFEVEGKLLYAHRTMLTLISDTFDAMLSERWTKKEEPIKIKDYSYDNIYQFLIFLYTAKCELNDENIFKMVDMAEFYGVQLFKNYCQNYLTTMVITVKNVFQLMDLAEKFSITRLQARVNNFIAYNFTSVIASDGFLKVNKDIAKKLVIDHKYEPEPEDLFRAVFNWTKQKAINKQTATLNLNDAIKAEICDFLPHILFRGMDLNFLHKFVVPRAFIFSGLDELSQVLCDRNRFFEGKVKVTNALGQTLHGNVIPDKTVLRNIESLKLMSNTGNIYCWWKTRFEVPSTPSLLKKRDGIEWYLFYLFNGSIGLRRCSFIYDSHYLLAELIAGPTGFRTTEGCKIEIE